MKHKTFFFIASASTVVLFVSGLALAETSETLPQSEGCSVSGNAYNSWCFQIVNTGTSPAFAGVSDQGIGVAGNSGGALFSPASGFPGIGVWGATESEIGVEGDSSNSFGVYGSGVTGVYGTSLTGNGVQGTTSNIGQSGVYGVTTTSGSYGVTGSSPSVGVWAASSGGASGGYGLWATNPGGVAISAEGNVTPYFNDTYSLGSSSLLWSVVYAKTGTINTSDARMKKDVEDINYGLSQIVKLRPVSYKWKSGSDTKIHLGIIAQEAEDVIPNIVYHGEKADEPLGVNYSELIPVLIKADQELKGQNDELRDRVKSLEAGRRPLVSGFGEGGIGLGMAAIAGGIVFASFRRKRTEARA